MIDEMRGLQSSGTWDLVSLPLGKFVLDCLWIFMVKVGSIGSIECLKACLVAKVYT